MSALLKIIKKNFKLLIRSKSSALIIILGPLLVIFLVGIAFDNLNKFSLSIGTYSDNYNDLTNSFITKLQEKEFSVQKINSLDECTSQIKQGKLNICIVFPKGMSLDSDKTNEIEFYVDNSKINLVWMVLDTISTKVEERSSELSIDLTTTLLNKIDLTKTGINEITSKLDNIKLENKQASDTLVSAQDGTVGAKFNDLKIKTESFKADLLQKIAGAESVILEASNKVDSSNMTNESKSSLKTRLFEIKTYLYNMKSKLQEQTNMSTSDFTVLKNVINDIQSSLQKDFDSIKAGLSSSDTELSKVQASLNLISSQLSDIKITNATTIVNPITTSIKPVTIEKTYLNYMFPSLVVLVIMFISILLSNTLVMMEKHSPAYFRNFITPTRDIVFILATYLTNVILVFIQLVIILVV
jgi:hypothetical protein